MLMRFLENISVFIFGAVGYVGIELLWRGSSHWTMLLAGGLCFCLIYHISHISGLSLIKKAIMCMFIITTVEFLIGIVVNLKLGMNVWDYSSVSMHLLGQICPRYCLGWLALSLPCLVFSRLVRKKVFAPNFTRSEKSPAVLRHCDGEIS